jgi:trk system potassium uptake protein TrkH
MFRAELPGPTPDKLAPRIAQTAAILWLVYGALTVVQTLLLWPAMGLFDAACHAFGTMSTGGYSTRNASLDHYGSVYIDTVVTVFMFIAGANFRALSGKGFPHARDREFRLYAGIVFVAIAAVTAFLLAADFPERAAHPEKYSSFGQCLRYASFQVVSIITTTGYVTADYEGWPSVCRAVILVLMVIGGCAESTTGGVKCIRVLLMTRFGLREIRKLVRPHAIIPLKIGGQSIERDVISRVMGFLSLYVIIAILAVLLLAIVLEGDRDVGADVVSESAAGLTSSPGARGDATLLTAIGAVFATIGNVGPGLGDVGPVQNYGGIPGSGKCILIFLMLLGRLEIYAVLVLLFPFTWRR